MCNKIILIFWLSIFCSPQTVLAQSIDSHVITESVNAVSVLPKLSQPVGKSAAKSLHNAITAFSKSFLTLVGDNSGFFPQLNDLLKPAPNIGALEQEFLTLKAHHQLYLASLNQTEILLIDNGHPDVYSYRLERVRAAYIDQIQLAVDELDQFFLDFNQVPQSSVLGLIGFKWTVNGVRSALIDLRESGQSNEANILRLSNLPYQSLSFSAQEITLEPQITPSYLSQTNVEATTDDMSTKDIPEEVVELAKKLDHSPIRIYEFVQGQVDTDWYYGSMKGSAGTMLHRAGNDSDQAQLLVDLLRVSGIAVRFVKGIIEMPSDEIAKLVGVADGKTALLALRSAGVPAKAIFSGGGVSAVQFQHTWVSAYIPYANYRGATVDASGLAWLPLMPAIKQYANEFRQSVLTRMNFDVSSLKQEFVSEIQPLDPLQTLNVRVDQYLTTVGSSETYAEQLRTHLLDVMNAGYIPNSLPVEVAAVTYEAATLPAVDIHEVRFYAQSDQNNGSDLILDATVKLSDLINKDLTLSYQAGSQEDHNLALSFGGLDNVPLYLIDLRPQIKLAGIPIKVANSVVPAGSVHRFAIDLVSPSGSYTINKSVISGSYHAIDISTGSLYSSTSDSNSELLTSKETRAGAILSNLGREYSEQWTRSENELAAVSGRLLVHPLPSVVFTSNDLEIQSLLDQPQSLDWRGINFDAAFRVTESLSASVDSLSETDFRKLSALQGSYLEHQVFERKFGVESISADKAMAIARAADVTILLLSRDDLATVESQLSNHPTDVIADIVNWLQLGFEVTVPEDLVSYFDWFGSAWIVENPEDGSAGYFIARGLAGGSTASDLPTDIGDALSAPNSEGINNDPNSAASVYLFPQTNFQTGSAGEEFEPLSVMVTDINGLRVKGAEVQFAVASGAGQFIKSDNSGAQSGPAITTVKTDSRGLAEVTYKSAQVIKENQIVSYMALNNSDLYSTEIALNYINVSVLRADQPSVQAEDYFTLISKPGEAEILKHLILAGNGLRGSVEGALGFEKIVVTDKFQNPVANRELELTAEEIRFDGDAYVVSQHRVLDEDCQGITRIDSLCGASQIRVASDAFGEVNVGIIFGRVNAAEDDDTIIDAEYPISVVLSPEVSLELPFEARSETRVAFTGPEQFAASEPESEYRGPATAKIFTSDDETVEAKGVNMIFGDFAEPSRYSGNDKIEYTDMPLGTSAVFYKPEAFWAVYKEVGGQITEEPEKARVSTNVAAVKITPALPPIIELGASLQYNKFDDFFYSSEPQNYTPRFAVMDLYEDGVLILSRIANATDGVNLSRGRVTLPPIVMDPSKRYQAEIVFNKGSQFSEVKSDRFDLPVSASVIREVGHPSGGGGGGAIIIDEINNASCTVAEPQFQLNLVQEARVTIETQAVTGGLSRTFISNKLLSKGKHIFDRNDTGFIAAFWNEGKTRFTITAQATSDGKTETTEGNFHLTISEISNLPVGSPVYENINLYKGNLFLTRHDIHVPGRGAELAFVRSYSSSSRGTSSFGPSWSHNYDSFVKEGSCGWVSVSGGIAGGVTFFPQEDGSYRPGKGYHSSLLKTDDGWDFYAKDGTKYHYNRVFPLQGRPIPMRPRNYLDHIEDPNGNRTTLAYSPQVFPAPRLEFIQDSSGRRIKLEYKRVKEIIDAAAVNDDESDEPEEGVFSASDTLLYDFSRSVISKVSGLDYQIIYDYDEYGRLVSVSNEDAFDSNQNASIVESYDYDRVKRAPPELLGVLVDFPSASAIRKITDPRGIESTFEYQRFEREIDIYEQGSENFVPFQRRDLLVTGVTKHKDELESTDDISSLISYTGKSRQNSPADATVIDPRGVEYLYRMDRFGRLVEQEGPTGASQMTWPENDTVPLTSTDENGVLTTYQYDEYGNTTSEQVTGPNGGSFLTTSTYETRANGTIRDLLKSKTDRRGHTTEFNYDDRGNLVRVTHPASDACAAPCQEAFAYLSNGDRSQAYDQRSKRTLYRYDAYGNPELINFPIGIKSAKFDLRSRKVEEIDENGNVSRFEFDWLNRLAQQTNAEGGVSRFEYDPNNNKVLEVDEEGRTTERLFDFDNRSIRLRIADVSSNSSNQITKTFGYDTNDNLIEETDFRGNQTTHSYDNANRKIQSRLPANALGVVREYEYTYDNATNILSQTIGGSGESQVSLFTYDNLYRKTSTTNPESGVTTVSYDGNNNVVQSIDELGRVMQYDYDEVNRKVAQRDAVGSAVQRSMQWEYDRAGNLLTYIDARGNREENTYDDRNRLIFKLNLDDNRLIYKYDDHGNLTDQFDHFGYHIRNQYDELHRKSKVIDQRNFITEINFDLLGNPILEKWPNGNQVERQFDFLNRPMSEQDSLGELTAYTYDDDNNKLTSSDGKGYVTRFLYDALGQKISEAQPESRTLLTEYDVFGNVSKTTDGEGNQTEYEYDKLNRQTKVIDALNQTIVTNYDPVSNKLSITDKRGNKTNWIHDELNRVSKVIEPIAGSHSREITNSYDANDNLSETVDKRGIVSKFKYDRLNRVIEETRSGVVVIKNTYSEIGDLIGLEDANGNKTAMEFNERHEMVLESRPETAISQYQYDSMGEIVSQIDPEGRQSTYVYDLRRRKLQETNGENESTAFEYDLNDNQILRTRPKQNAWAYSYDELNRLTQITDADNKLSSYGYDNESNQTRHTDANGNTTLYEYDKLNRKSVKRYPITANDAAFYSYDYDENSNLLVKVDANGQLHTHAYDSLNRLISIDYTNSLVPQARQLQTEMFEYDGNNNLINVTETYNTETRTDSYVFDDFDRLYNRTDSFNKTIGYRYDLNGNRTKLIDTDGLITSYVYDGLNRVTNVAVTSNGQTNYEYDKSSLIKQISYPNNTRASYQYDQAMRTTLIHNQQNNATVSNFEYEFDNNGNRLVQKEINGGAEEITTYVYDKNDRLVVVNYPEEQVVYTYDPAYNRETEIRSNPSEGETTNKLYNYNPRNQLTDVEDNIEVSNNVAYIFDKNGNQTSKIKSGEQSSFVFDIRDDLREVQIDGSSVGQFLYDYQGLRIEKLGERGTERSSYDGQSILQQYDHANQTRAKFDYGPDRLLSLNTVGETPQFYLCDALQSVVNLTNDQGAIQARYQYDAWGNKRAEVGRSYNRFSFTGYEEDKETGLLYAKARFLDPDTGKFLSEDAWEGDNMTAPSLHRYLYAYQNPTVYIDPDGNAAYAFDGTSQDKDDPNTINPSNVAKLWRLYRDGRAFYQAGVAKNDGIMNVPGLISGYGGDARLELMYRDLVLTYNGLKEEGDKVVTIAEDKNIDIIGFSRGAALARAFANIINERGIPDIRHGFSSKYSYNQRIAHLKRVGSGLSTSSPAIRSLLIFDTVGSFVSPGNSNEGNKDLSIPANVENVRHAIAAREGRWSFPLTTAHDLDNLTDPRIYEKAFEGDHSDIGGSHSDDDSLSLDPLNWMLEQGSGLGIKFDSVKPRNQVITSENALPYLEKRRLQHGREITFQVPQQGSRHIHDLSPFKTGHLRNRNVIYRQNQKGPGHINNKDPRWKKMEAHLETLEALKRSGPHSPKRHADGK